MATPYVAVLRVVAPVAAPSLVGGCWAEGLTAEPSTTQRLSGADGSSLSATAGNFPGNWMPAEDQDHGTGMGPNYPASVAIAWHRPTQELSADLHKRLR